MRRRRLKKLLENELKYASIMTGIKKWNRNKCPQCKKFTQHKPKGERHKVCDECKGHNFMRKHGYHPDEVLDLFGSD